MFMCVLNDAEIKEQADMIIRRKDKRIKSSSYDLSAGSEYLYSHKNKINKSGFLSNKIRIPAHTLCYVLVEEELNLPQTICATIYPRHDLLKKGILMYPQPAIDPGYRGALYVLLHNLTDENKEIRKNKLATIVFYKMTNPPEKPYSGPYLDSKNLIDLGFGKDNFESYTSAIKHLSEKIESLKENLIFRYIPTTLTMVTIIVACLTFIVTLLVTTGLIDIPNIVNLTKEHLYNLTRTAQ